MPTSLEHHSVEQCPVSLVCGYNLGSEPLASVTWTDPQGNVVTNSDLYAIDNGPSVVRLNITSTNKIHNGTWKCNITVTYADGSVNETVIDIPLVVHGESPLLCIHTYMYTNYVKLTFPKLRQIDLYSSI